MIHIKLPITIRRVNTYQSVCKHVSVLNRQWVEHPSSVIKKNNDIYLVLASWCI